MGCVKRGRNISIAFRPFGGKQLWIAAGTDNMDRARETERQIRVALQSGDYRSLDTQARAVAVALFQNQGWEIPEDLSAGRPTEELTLWKAMEIFLRDPDIQKSRERQRYKYCNEHLVLHFGKEYPVKSLWVPQIKQFRAKRRGQGAAPATVNREVSTLSRIFGVLCELQYVDANPCRLLKRLSEKSGEREVYLSLKHIELITAQCPSWYAPMVWTAYYTGMRRGEVLGLTWKQVNLQKRLILLSPKDTKEQDWKRIPIRQELVPILEACMKVRSLETDRVFLLMGEPPSSESLKNPWRKACKAIGLESPRPRFHDLRHTWKTNARRSKMDPEIRERIMGHAGKRRSVEERYGRISNQELVTAIDGMTFDHGETEILVANLG